MKLIKDNKGILVAIVLFVLAILIYNALFKTEEVVPTESPTASVGNEVLEMFTALGNVSFDQDLFNSSGYQLLTDFSTNVPVQPTGRRNPFDSIGNN